MAQEKQNRTQQTREYKNDQKYPKRWDHNHNKDGDATSRNVNSKLVVQNE